jgi:hypothetical protein
MWPQALARLVAFLLIAEAMFAGLHVANLLPFLAAHDGLAITLIVARALLGALQFTGGWMIASRRPNGYVIGRWALAIGAILTVLDVGMNLAPANVFGWLRTEWTVGYAIYAALGWIVLRRGQWTQETRQ